MWVLLGRALGAAVAAAAVAYLYRWPSGFRSHVVGIIPARFTSTRFEGKPLVHILGKALIQATYEITRSRWIRTTEPSNLLAAFIAETRSEEREQMKKLIETSGISCVSQYLLLGGISGVLLAYQEWAHKQYVAKHQQWASQQWGNFYYYRMHNISDIYFIGGFGTVAWIDVKEYETIQPDKIAVDGGDLQSLKELNAIFSKPLREVLSSEGEVDDAALISVDSKGIDIRVRQGAQFNIQRLAFDVPHKVETMEEAKKALHEIIKDKQQQIK